MSRILIGYFVAIKMIYVFSILEAEWYLLGKFIEISSLLTQVCALVKFFSFDAITQFKVHLFFFPMEWSSLVYLSLLLHMFWPAG
jgi:hypothetical protein